MAFLVGLSLTAALQARTLTVRPGNGVKIEEVKVTAWHWNGSGWDNKDGFYQDISRPGTTSNVNVTVADENHFLVQVVITRAPNHNNDGGTAHSKVVQKRFNPGSGGVTFTAN